MSEIPYYLTSNTFPSQFFSSSDEVSAPNHLLISPLLFNNDFPRIFRGRSGYLAQSRRHPELLARFQNDFSLFSA